MPSFPRRTTLLHLPPQPFNAEVSIPQWCDCCRKFEQSEAIVGILSIPQWCDCCAGSAGAGAGALPFQSHNGAIAADRPDPQGSPNGKFQSHNGAIAAISALCRSLRLKHCFNPTMVRLLLVKSVLAQFLNFFQSHNGAIAARSLQAEFGFCATFNPTMVRLLLRTLRCLFAPSWSFNPTMVRLLPPRELPRTCCGLPFNPTMVRLLLTAVRGSGKVGEAFQSHNGAIAASSLLQGVG